MSALMGMMMAGLLATGTAPDMWVDAGDLAMARPGDAAVLAERIQAASRSWCARYRSLLTPNDVGMPSVCEHEMKRRAFYQLPRAQRRLFVQAGGRRTLNRP